MSTFVLQGTSVKRAKRPELKSGSTQSTRLQRALRKQKRIKNELYLLSPKWPHALSCLPFCRKASTAEMPAGPCSFRNEILGSISQSCAHYEHLGRRRGV